MFYRYLTLCYVDLTPCCTFYSSCTRHNCSHKELIERNGLYADLVRLQMTGDDDDQPDETAAATGPGAVGLGLGAGAESSHPPGLPYESNAVVPAHMVPKTAPPPPPPGKAPAPTPVDAKDSKKAKADEEDALTKAANKAAWGKIWHLIMQHPLWFTTALLGAAVFGAIFPSWGLLLAKTQRMFYYTNPDTIRENANLLACFYILLAGLAIISATLQFWGVAQVGERISMKLRSAQFENILRREIAFFDDESNSIGDLTTKLSDDSRIVHKVG